MTRIKISVITFDLDNTLWDVGPVIIKAEQAQQKWLLQHRPDAAEAFDQEGLLEFKKAVWKDHPELCHHISQMRIQMLYELQLAAGYSEEKARSGAQQAFDVFFAERHKVDLYADALNVLKLLAQRYTLGALTNGNADIYKTDAAQYFDFAFSAEDMGASKPDPAMFQAALKNTGVIAENVIHVGDDPEHDIRGAKDIGMHTVWVNIQQKAWPDGANRADIEIASLRQLPDAIDQIVDADK